MSHLIDLIQQIEREHHLDRESVCVALEDALAAAARRQYPRGEITARVDRTEGAVEVTFQGDPLKPDDVLIGTDARVFARLSDERLRALAAASVLARYATRAGDLVAGTVTSVLRDVTGVKLADGAEGVIAAEHLLPMQFLCVGQAIEAVVVAARKTESGGAVVVLSRTRPELVSRYLEQIVPEIADGAVKIEAVAREGGYRTKVLLRATRPGIDPVACVAGAHGERLQAVASRLGGERIDLVEYSPDVHEICAAALAPAEVEEVLAFPLAAALVAIVPAGQEPIARGRRDGNMRLAAQLCKVDVLVRSREAHELSIGKAVQELMETLKLGQDTARELADAGIETAGDLEFTDAEEIAKATGLEIWTAEGVMGRLSKNGA